MPNKKRITEMIEYYDRRAPWHDHYMSYTGNENMERLFKPIIDKITPLVTNKNIIEIACGTGNWTQVLAKIANSVLGIDSSPKSLEIAKEKLETFKNYKLEIGDAYNLINIKEKYDVAFTADFFSHIPKKMISKFLDGLKNVLNPDGLVMIFEMSNKEFFLENFDFHTDADGDLVDTRQLPDGSVSEVVKNFYSENDLRELLINHSDDVIFHEFKEFERWLLIYRI